MRILDFADGFTSSASPTVISYPATLVSVTPSGNLSSITAQAALVELQGDIDTLNGKIGAASGIASLDSNGKVPTSQIPALALVDVSVVADLTARNALTVQEGDVAVVTNAGGGVSKTYLYDGSSWIELLADGSLSAHLANTTGAHAASAISFSPVGTIASSDAQSAIAEVATDAATALTSGLATKEPTITATTSVDYYRGDKTFASFASAVRSTVLTGLSLVSTTAISVTDTVLVALGSLQAQITALTSSVSGKLAIANNLSDLNNAGTARTNLGIGNIDNTSDANKPVSTAQATADALKIDKSTATTKGDLLAASAASTIARLGVGSDGQVLTADAAQTLGVKWATPSATSVATGGVVSSAFAQTSAFLALTATAVDDDTIPQSSETTIITALNLTYTAASTSNRLRLTVVLNFGNDTSANVIIPAAFIDSGANAVAATRILYTGASFVPHVVTLQFELTPSDTSSHIYKIGVGKVGGGLTLNGLSGARKLGGVLWSSMKLEEIKG